MRVGLVGVCAGLLVSGSLVLRAQTGPTVTFTQGNVASAAQAQGFTYRLVVTPAGSPTANPPVALTGVTCTGTGPAPITVSCTAALPVAASAALVTGYSTRLSAQDGLSAESVLSGPFVPGASVPGALRVSP